jgi:hypothetical protein
VTEIRNLWRREEWSKFSKSVKSRDDYKCLQCGRSNNEVVLQVHHNVYVEGKAPWEYILSDCLTLCKGCHAREHGLIEPVNGWTLLSIHDLGSPVGRCERIGCNRQIRFEHFTYHPDWGYQTVGIKCVEHLTRADRAISEDFIKLYERISDFMKKSVWESGRTERGKPFIEAVYKRSHKIRIYGYASNVSFQIALKVKGKKYHEYGDVYSTKVSSLEQTKELAFVALLGSVSEDEKKKEKLRTLYRYLNT